MFKILVVCKDKASLSEVGERKSSFIDYCTIDDIQTIGGYTFCIIHADFEKNAYFEKVKNLIRQNTNVNYWGGDFLCSKDNILKAYSLGCKNFVRFPISDDIIQKYSGLECKNVDSESNSQKYEEFENMKVLIVDDNDINIELLKEVLSVFNVDTISFNDSEQAFDYAVNNSADLILLDIMMPNLNGFEFAEKIKENSKNFSTPIVFISALSGQENKFKGYSTGSFAYIEKPFDINTVRVRLFNILKIQKLQKQREDFIATLTHDLKTPIRAQVRALELLLDLKFGGLTTEQTDILQEILSSCRLLNFMTDDLLVKYKYDNGALKIKREYKSLKALIEEKIHYLRYIFEQKQQIVRYSYKTNMDYAEIDMVEIGRVMNNLLINASEYTKNNGSIYIEVRNNALSNTLEVSIKNEAQIMSAEVTEEIFEKYYSNSKKYNKIGAGLGLYISKKIVELHGGKIWFQMSSDRKYIEFVFSVPIKTAGIKAANTI